MLGASSLLLCALSAVLAKNEDTFTYMEQWNQYRRSHSTCDMCYNGICLTSDEARCDYYAAASAILAGDGTGDGTDVEYKIDDMLFDFVDKASSSATLMDCVPLISQYTDCTEENICTGCRVCNCDAEGKWNCSLTQQCSARPKVRLDHRVFGVVIANLKNYRNTHQGRIRRSINFESSLENKDIITPEDISKWLYDTEPRTLAFEAELNITDEIGENIKENDKEGGIFRSTASNAETTYDSTTPLSDIDNDSFSPQNPTAINTTPDTEILLFDDILQGLTTKDNQVKANYELGRHDYSELYTKKRNDINDVEYDPIRLVKRDTFELHKVSDTEISVNNNQTDHANNVNNKTIEHFKEALFRINQLINEKNREIQELITIRENLANYARLHINMNITTNIGRNNTYNSKHHVIIYKLNILGECLGELKEVFNTIENITQTEILKNSTDLTNDLKVLLRAIKYYVYIESDKQHKIKLNRKLSSPGYRASHRRIMKGRDLETFNPVDDLGNIFEEINRMTSLYNTFNHLSEHACKIIRRVIKQFYLDEFTPMNVIMYDTHYGLENYLKNIGNNWEILTQKITDSSAIDKVYRMKLLHLMLNEDIDKMENSLSLINFAQTRRMTVANGAFIEQSILRIKNNLRLIDLKIQLLMNTPDALRIKNNGVKSPKLKMSLIQKLKNAFNNSRKQIRNLLKNKVPKSEIMKQIAKKQIEELKRQRMLENRETMKRWQETLKVVPRRKRSAWGFQNFIDRLKNILPSYLRGKVRPAISKKGANKTKTARTHRKKGKKTAPTTRATTLKARETKEQSLSY